MASKESAAVKAPVGILLINLGTPEGPTAEPVAKYLREFLMDPYVIDIPWMLRWPLVNGIIAPFRSQTTALKYQKVWSSEGSPLLKNMLDLKSALSKKLGSGYMVEMGMRYGQPDFQSALGRLRAAGVRDLLVLPLYPQYAESSTLSSILKIKALAASDFNLQILRDFFVEDEFIASFHVRIQEALSEFSPDFILFSYHGLPERHIEKVEPGCSSCLKTLDCQLRDLKARPLCYRGQCFATTEALALRLGLKKSQYMVSFQSRLGRRPWIAPYTDLVLPDLVAQGHKKVLVVCPAFTCDCLETLEEIKVQAKSDFIKLGGEDLRLVSSLNAHPIWVDNLARFVARWISEPRSVAPLLWPG